MPNQRRIRPLAQTTLPPKAVRIGRWAPNVTYPHHGYLDPVAEISPYVHETLQRQFKHLYEEEDRAGMNLQGTILASGSYKKHDHDQEFIATSASKIYQLDNPEALFSDAIQHQDNRKWIESALKAHGTIYMIIGYQTVHDAHIGGDAQHGKESSGTFQAPVTVAVAATTGVPLEGNLLDPGFGYESYKTARVQQSFSSPGEQVVAVQYRRIRFRFFNSRKIGMKNLETETRWQYVWDMRGQTPDANDVIEASLAFDDLEDDADEGNGFDDLLDMSSDNETCNTAKKTRAAQVS